MVFDTVTLIVCVALIVLAICSPLCNPLRRKPRVQGSSVGPDEWQPISVVMSVHDNAVELEHNLPAMLEQDYAPGYEVIVVDESSTDDTVDVLKRLRREHDNLYVTYIPESSHYLSRRKLSLTVGVKAAKHEWLIFTTADSRPCSPTWLQAMASHCAADVDMVLGLSCYSEEATAYQRFERMATAMRQLRKATKTAYAYCGANLALRKSLFMGNGGFAKNLKYLRGEFDFIVNEYASTGRTAIAIEPEAKMVQDAPSRKTWLNHHLFYIETRKHLSRSFAYRMVGNVDTILLHVNFVAQMLALALSVVSHNWTVTTVAALCVVATLALRLTYASRAMALLGETVPLWMVPLLELMTVWQQLAFRVKYRLSDRNDFIRR